MSRHTTNTLLLSAALAAATGFALGRVTGPAAEPQSSLPTPEPAHAEPPKGAPHAEAAPGANPHAQGATPPMLAEATPNEKQAISWTKPAAWKEAPNPNTMRLATYLAPSAAGESSQAELAVSRAGGSLDANIERWAGQFGDEGKTSLKRESREIAGLRVTLVSTSGSNFTAMSGEVKQGEVWQMLAAIVESPDGSDQAYFFKMTGTKKNVESARKDFDALVASVRKAS